MLTNQPVSGCITLGMDPNSSYNICLLRLCLYTNSIFPQYIKSDRVLPKDSIQGQVTNILDFMSHVVSGITELCKRVAINNIEMNGCGCI